MATTRTIKLATSKLDISKLCEKLSESANQAVAFLESKLQKDGSYGNDAKDLACYFKSPMMFLAANKPQAATSILTHIKTAFMTKDGDFTTNETQKSINGAYAEFWSYTNGWIVRAANQLDITEISQPGCKYLDQYNLGEKAGFLTNNVRGQTVVTDVLTVAHHGLINLEIGNLDVAISAGDFLCEAINKQPNLKNGFNLRFDKQGNLITEFPKEQAPFYFISASKPNQLHFMIGYPSAYLAILYKKTKNEKYLNAAKAYLDFSLSCDKSIYECDFSHKIAWAASFIYECTGDGRYLTVIDKISDYFIAKQKNGMWFSEDINSSYDQSAEIACWFLDIVKNVNGLKKKANLEEEKLAVPKSNKAWTMQELKYGTMALIAGVGLYTLLKYRTKTTGLCDAVVNIARGLNGVR